MIHDRWRRWCDDNGRRCGFVDDRWRMLTLIAVMRAPFAALMLVAPLMFTLFVSAPTPAILICTGWVCAHSA